MRQISSLIFALVACVNLGHAFSDAEDLHANFSRIDFDKNSQISVLEWDQYSFALFRRADANQDDMLETGETIGDTITENIIARADANQDGFLRIDEFMKLRRSLFIVADINRGEFLNEVELTLFTLISETGWTDTNYNARFDFSELRTSLGNIFRRADANQDSELTRAEANFLSEEEYARASSNGALTTKELYSLYVFHLTGE